MLGVEKQDRRAHPSWPPLQIHQDRYHYTPITLDENIVSYLGMKNSMMN